MTQMRKKFAMNSVPIIFITKQLFRQYSLAGDIWPLKSFNVAYKVCFFDLKKRVIFFINDWKIRFYLLCRFMEKVRFIQYIKMFYLINMH